MGKTIAGEFLTYWRAHSVTNELGLPLSSEFAEVAPDGKIHRVQYFEKAKLILYPDRLPPNNITLSPSDRAAYDEVVSNETWPAFDEPLEDWTLQVKDMVSRWKRNGGVYSHTTALYEPFGVYMDSVSRSWDSTPAMKPDAAGLPTVKYGDAYFYNPTTIAQYCLSMYSKLLSGQDTKASLLKAGEKLLAMQDEEGAFRYNFSWEYEASGETFEPGWVSGIAQGQALSAFARLYHLTGDKRYLAAGDKALRFLLKPVAEGGLMDTMEDLHPSLSHYIFFQEYVANPASYTLNGYIFALLGLYDWSNTISRDAPVARDFFERGMDTLGHILPYYDIGGVSSYDMAHITYEGMPAVYFDYHILVLNLLNTVESLRHNARIEYQVGMWETLLKP